MTKTIINGSESEVVVENKTPEIESTEASNKSDDNNNEQGDLGESISDGDTCVRYDMLNSHLDQLNFTVIMNSFLFNSMIHKYNIYQKKD